MMSNFDLRSLHNIVIRVVKNQGHEFDM